METQQETITCEWCSAECKPNGCSTGYIVMRDGKNTKICYECAAIDDKRNMRNMGLFHLYLTETRKHDIIRMRYELTNWPGSLRFNLLGMKIGKHNIAGIRRDVWFVFEGYVWHGVQYGDNSQICRVKRTKERWIKDEVTGSYYGKR